MRSITLSVLAALALATAAPAQNRADQHSPQTPTLAVTGSAAVDVPPDQLEITFAVVSEAEEVADALEDNSRRMRRVLDALRKAGVRDDDLETAGFSINPQYARNRSTNEAPRIVGYSVQNSAVARTTRLDLAGKLIEEGTDAGANRVSGLAFGLQNPQDHRNEAIAKATAHARADAEALADAAGLTLAGVLEITLDPGQQTYRPSMMRGMEAMADAAPPIQPGDVSLSARVRVVYEIKPKQISLTNEERTRLGLDDLSDRVSAASIVQNALEGTGLDDVMSVQHAAWSFMIHLEEHNYHDAMRIAKPDTAGYQAIAKIQNEISTIAETSVEQAAVKSQERVAHLEKANRPQRIARFGRDHNFETGGAECLSITDDSARVRVHFNNGQHVDLDLEKDSGSPGAWLVVPPPSGIPTLN